jgi:putative salt-induced outer membrane protein YdiY
LLSIWQRQYVTVECVEFPANLIPMTLRQLRYPFLALFLYAPVVLQADVIHLKNGDWITGEIKEIWDDNITIEPEYSDKFDVEFEHIAHVESDNAMEVELFDGTKGAYLIEPADEEGNVRLTSSYESIVVALADVKKTEKIEKFDWKANLDVSSNFSRGNTDSQTTNLQWKGSMKTGDHRYNTDLSIAREELNGERTRQRDRLNAGYNYLFHDDWFFAMNLTAERDPVAQLDRRISFNPALGYDVFDDADRVLNFQLGAGYASEKTAGEDESSTNIDWRLEFLWSFMGEDLEFFHNHNIYRNLQGRRNTVFTSQTGIRYDITDDIYLNLQTNYDYDTEPADGAENDDLAFLIGAGMEF